MEKKKGFSVLRILITIICIVLVIISLAANIAFSRKKTPKLFDRYIYVVDESNPLSGDITTGAALLAKNAEGISIAEGDIVLCYPADNPSQLTLRSIGAVITADDGTEKYYTRDAIHEDNTDSITKDKVVAVCTGYPESLELGEFITFVTNVKGIIALLILPCIILVILLITKIVSAKSGDEDEDSYGFYDYEDDGSAGNAPHAKGSEPLFVPTQDQQASSEFERKKQSIAENFSQKQVNPESPYQKERERTMQFKAQRSTISAGTGSVSASSAESAFAARNLGAQSSTAPTADALREEMLRKTAEAERTGTFSIKTTNATTQSGEQVSDNTGILSKSQLEQMSREEAPKPVAPARPAQPAAKPAARKKSSTPDISDIISKSTASKKSDPSSMSVDDLLKMIEDEKNKL